MKMAVEKKYDLTSISLGGGVQSTALLGLSATGGHGVPKADFAIFADTGHELEDTYQNIKFLTDWAGERGIPVHTVTRGSLEEGFFVKRQWKKRTTTIPVFTKGENGKRGGILRRFCTNDYKIEAIHEKLRELTGRKKGDRMAGKVLIRAMMGISLDEYTRMRESQLKWVENSYPLVDAKLTRDDCRRVIGELGLPQPVKSACYFCPFHSNEYWIWLKTERPVYFAKAVEFDRRLRTDGTTAVLHSMYLHSMYLHSSMQPLDQVDFEAMTAQKKAKLEERRAQRWDKNGKAQLALFGDDPEVGFQNECEGVCGV
jgi:hypothetical protein